jgi:hypothetical protein
MYINNYNKKKGSFDLYGLLERWVIVISVLGDCMRKGIAVEYHKLDGECSGRGGEGYVYVFRVHGYTKDYQ